LEAAKLAGIISVPILVVPRKDITKKQMLLFNVTENVQREDLNPVDEALAYARLQAEHSMSTDDIAASLGIKKRRLEKRFALLKLEPVVRDAVHDGRVTVSAALEIDRLPREKQGKFLEIAEELSTKKLELLVNKELEKIQKKIEGLEREPKEPKEVDPASVVENIRRIHKSSSILCKALDYSTEDSDRMKAVNFRTLDVDDLIFVTNFFENLASKEPQDVDINDKASAEIIEAVETLGNNPTMTLDFNSPVFRNALTSAIGETARELALEDSAGSGKRPKVTFAIAEKALEMFFIKTAKS
jgi:ParB-like chromosome segregation protein Spo0J